MSILSWRAVKDKLDFFISPQEYFLHFTNGSPVWFSVKDPMHFHSRRDTVAREDKRDVSSVEVATQTWEPTS